MKLSINFISYPEKSIRLVGVALLLINAGLIGALIYVYFDSQALQLDNQSLQQKNSNMSGKLVSMQQSAKDLPSRNELIELQEKVKTINHVLRKHQYDPGTAFKAIEISVPKNVFLRNYSYDSQNGQVKLRAVSSKNRDLLTFFKKLEKHRAFQKALLVRQDTIKEQGKLQYRFEISLEQAL